MDVSIAIGKYINSLSQFSVVLTLEEKVKHHKRKNNYLDTSGGKNKKTRTGTEAQNSSRSPQSARPVRYVPASFSRMSEAEVDGVSSAVEIVLEVSPVEGRQRTLTTGMPQRSPLVGAMEEDAQTSFGARL